jgi:hypothetical protein
LRFSRRFSRDAHAFTHLKAKKTSCREGFDAVPEIYSTKSGNLIESSGTEMLTDTT